MISSRQLCLIGGVGHGSLFLPQPMHPQFVVAVGVQT